MLLTFLICRFLAVYEFLIIYVISLLSVLGTILRLSGYPYSVIAVSAHSLVCGAFSYKSSYNCGNNYDIFIYGSIYYICLSIVVLKK